MGRSYDNYFSDWRTREVKARWDHPCDHCGGTIYRGTFYLNYDDPKARRRWVRREHIDCTAPWYIIPGKPRCGNMANLPGRPPPPDERDERLSDIPVTIRFPDGLGGEVSWRLPEELRDRLLHARKASTQRGAQDEVGAALGLMAQLLHRACGHRKHAMQVSNLLEEVHQFLMITSPPATETTKE